jgi:hypothetical protein
MSVGMCAASCSMTDGLWSSPVVLPWSETSPVASAPFIGLFNTDTSTSSTPNSLPRPLLPSGWSGGSVGASGRRSPSPVASAGSSGGLCVSVIFWWVVAQCVWCTRASRCWFALVPSGLGIIWLTYDQLGAIVARLWCVCTCCRCRTMHPQGLGVHPHLMSHYYSQWMDGWLGVCSIDIFTAPTTRMIQTLFSISIHHLS